MGRGRSPCCPSLPCSLASSSSLHCLLCQQWRHEGSSLPPRRGRPLAREPPPRRPSVGAAVPTSTPRPLTAAVVPLRVAGVAPVVVGLSMRGDVPWSCGLPGRASTRRRCCRSSSCGRRTRPAPSFSSRASSPASCRPQVQAGSGCRRTAAAAKLHGLQSRPPSQATQPWPAASRRLPARTAWAGDAPSISI